MLIMFSIFGSFPFVPHHTLCSPQLQSTCHMGRAFGVCKKYALTKSGGGGHTLRRSRWIYNMCYFLIAAILTLSPLFQELMIQMPLMKMANQYTWTHIIGRLASNEKTKMLAKWLLLVSLGDIFFVLPPPPPPPPLLSPVKFVTPS